MFLRERKHLEAVEGCSSYTNMKSKLKLLPRRINFQKGVQLYE